MQAQRKTFSKEVTLLIYFMCIAFLNGLSAWFIAWWGIAYSPGWMFLGTLAVSTTILVVIWVIASVLMYLKERPPVATGTVGLGLGNMDLNTLVQQLAIQQGLGPQGQLPTPPAGQPQPSENPPPGAKGETFIDFTPNFPRENFTDLQPDLYMHQ